MEQRTIILSYIKEVIPTKVYFYVNADPNFNFNEWQKPSNVRDSRISLRNLLYKVGPTKDKLRLPTIVEILGTHSKLDEEVGYLWVGLSNSIVWWDKLWIDECTNLHTEYSYIILTGSTVGQNSENNRTVEKHIGNLKTVFSAILCNLLRFSINVLPVPPQTPTQYDNLECINEKYNILQIFVGKKDRNFLIIPIWLDTLLDNWVMW